MLVDFSKEFDFIHRGKKEQILQVYGLSKETVSAIMRLYKNTNAMVHSLDSDTNLIDIVAGVWQGDKSVQYMHIICLDYELRTPINLEKTVSKLKKIKNSQYLTETMTGVDYADYQVLLVNTPTQAESQPSRLVF